MPPVSVKIPCSRRSERSAPSIAARRTSENHAIAEFRSVVGRTLRVQHINGYVGNDSVSWCLIVPLRVRVLPMSREAILRWNGSWLDPFWDVEIIDPPEELQLLRGPSVDGTSYLDGHPEGWRAYVKEPETTLQRWMRQWKLRDYKL